jgi:hypothetical protein
MTLMSRTEGDYYDMEQPVITGTKMTTDYGWGFCTNECAQEKGRNYTHQPYPETVIFIDYILGVV